MVSRHRRQVGWCKAASAERGDTCSFAIEQPDTFGPEVVASSPSPQWKARPKQFSRSQQDGI